MEDLLLFDELRDSYQPLRNYYSIEQELNETKHKLKLLEERLKQLEEKNNTTNNLSLSMFPIINPLRNTELYYCDVNCKEIKIDANLYIFMEECLFCNIWDFKLINHLYDENPSVKFLQQFKNVKTLIIDFTSSIVSENNIRYQSKSRLTEILLNVCKIILQSNNDYEILFQSISLQDNTGARNELLFTQLFCQFTNYKKITVEIRNNLVVNSQTGCASYQSQPYIKETKLHCLKNNIEFESNIGV